ncbi:MAG: DNA repair protein RadA [Gammaproteobacteria bacterium]|nr:DNA repair protein RadA [Gammaproteobacteria bacterium]
MAKAKVQFVCNACGAIAPKWNGQCPECGAWNALHETVVTPSSRTGGYAGVQSNVQRLSEISAQELPRVSSGTEELDRVLGGGLIPGAVILLGGDPGIGKSTLLLQNAIDVSTRLSTLYVTGEESPQQVSLRAHRLHSGNNEVRILAETRCEAILDIAQTEKPKMMVIDSIQTMYSEQLQSAPGSVAQVRECTAQLVRFAKANETTIFLVGHVTKEGTLAGPRVLEHMVDTVLYFEGDPGSRFRIVRAIKNRFGAVNELGVFAMTERGLREVTNPSSIFLSRHERPVSGSVIMVTREGTRPMLVELQALVDESPLAQPRRVTLGLEQNRLAMLLAVLHRHGGIQMYNQDVYVNVVGGVRVAETGSDLPLVLAVLSSFRDKPVAPDWVVFGEIGLAGEIRPVQNGEERLREAAKHGFKRAIVPAANAPRRAIDGLEVVAVSRLQEALDHWR